MSVRHQILEVRLYRCITFNDGNPKFNLENASRLLGRRITRDAKHEDEYLMEFEYTKGNVYLRSDGSLVTWGFDTYASALVAITTATFEVLTIPATAPPYEKPVEMHNTMYKASNVKIMAVTAFCMFGHLVDIPGLLLQYKHPAAGGENGRCVIKDVTVEGDAISFWITCDGDLATRIRVHSDGRAMIALTKGWKTPFEITQIVQRCALESEKVLEPYFHG